MMCLKSIFMEVYMIDEDKIILDTILKKHKTGFSVTKILVRLNPQH